jgi:hypothetical protein
VAERLRAAAAEGRIGFDELEERLGATLASRTYAELETVVADLPSTRPVPRRGWVPASPAARIAVALAIVVPVIVAAVFLVTAFLASWMLWGLAGWWFFGHHHRRYRGRPPRAYGSQRRQAGAGPGRGYWA